MKKIIILILCLISIDSFSQSRKQRNATFDKMNSGIRRNYVSAENTMKVSGLIATVSGLAIIGFHFYEGNEAWKYATQSSGFKYKSYFQQGTRPFMIPIGLTLSIGGIVTMIRN